MAGQPPPWAYTAVLLCALSLSGAIEIPMDRESPVRLESADWGRGVSGVGRGGESEDPSEKAGTAEAVASGFRAGFPPEDQPGRAHAWEPGTWSRWAMSQGRGCAEPRPGAC